MFYCYSKPVDILMSRTNWLANEKLCLRRLKKNRENSNFDKSKYHKVILTIFTI